MKIRLQHVHYMPKNLELGVLYVSNEFGTAAHLCACGCGSKIRTPLGPTFFSQEGAYSILSPEIMRKVTFKQHNLLEDTYETRFDLILCRNVTIYFTDEGKDLVNRKFSSALKSGGYLLVGSTEQISNSREYGLEPVHSFIYRKV